MRLSKSALWQYAVSVYGGVFVQVLDAWRVTFGGGVCAGLISLLRLFPVRGTYSEKGQELKPSEDFTQKNTHVTAELDET